MLVACATGTATNRSRARLPETGCLDTLPASDSVHAVVKLSLRALDTAITLPPDFEGLFAEDFRAHLNVPAMIPLSVVTGLEPCDSIGSRCVAGMLTLSATAYAIAHATGEITDVAIVDETLTPRVAASIRAAINGMARDRLAPPLGGRDSATIVIEIGVEDQPDTVPPPRRLFRSVVPRYDAPFTYARMPSSGVDVRYPFTAGLAGIGDSVVVAFTVQADGTIAAESVDLLTASYRDFVGPVVEALAETRYHPAHLGDCAVASRLKQRFVFKAGP
jgi:hypothetical protein